MNLVPRDNDSNEVIDPPDDKSKFNKHNLSISKFRLNISEIDLSKESLIKYLHDINDIENAYSISSYKLLMILVCGITCLGYYASIIIFSFGSHSIRKEVGVTSYELGLMFFLIQIFSLVGNLSTVLADQYGRLNVYIGCNILYLIFGVLLVITYQKWLFITLAVSLSTMAIGICNITMLMVQECIRSNLRYTVIGGLFVFESLGLFVLIILLYVLDDNWRLSFLIVISLMLVALVLTTFMTDSYRWFIRTGNMIKGMTAINYICDFQSEPYRVVYITADDMYKKYGVYIIKKVNYEFVTELDNPEEDAGGIMKTFKNVAYLYSTRNPKFKPFVILSLYAFSISWISWIFIIYYPDFLIESSIYTSTDFNKYTIFSSIAMVILVIGMVATIHLYEKRITLVIIHILSTILAGMLVNIGFIESQDYRNLLLMVGMGTIHGFGRILFVILSGLSVETTTSEYRGLVFFIITFYFQLGLICGHYGYTIFYQIDKYWTLTCNVFLSVFAIIVASANWYMNKNESSELPD